MNKPTLGIAILEQILRWVLLFCEFCSAEISREKAAWDNNTPDGTVPMPPGYGNRNEVLN